MKSPIGLALVGCGRWGRRWLSTLEQCEEVDLRWVCDPRPPTEWEALTRARWALDLGPVLSDQRVDALVVATSVETHFEVAERALLSGRHVLVEKPLVTDTVSLERLNAIALQHQLQLMVNHLLLYHPAVTALARVIPESVGAIHGFWGQRFSVAPRRDDSAWWTLAPHDLSLIDRLAPRLLEAEVDTRHVGSRVEARLRSPEQQAQLSFDTSGTKKLRLFVVAGERGTLVFDDTANHPLSLHERVLAPELLGRLTEERALRSKLGFGEAIPCPGPVALEAAARHFLAAVRGAQPALSGPAHALRVVTALERGQPFRAAGLSVDIA